MNSFKLITAVVPHGKSDRVSRAALNAGSWGGTVLSGRGISSNGFLDALGLGETSRNIVMILTESEKCTRIFNSIIDECSLERNNFGFIFTTNANQMLKTGNITGEKAVMNVKGKHQLITVILNRGYADDAMAAARKAGAAGGTVLNALGTAKEDDEKFFGVHIVPEKEMLMIVVDEEKKDSILEAIKTLDCLSQPGSGIAFCTDIESFNVLGKK